MACQPAVELSTSLPMTRDAEVHLELFPFKPVNSFHVAVTVDAIEFAPFQMGNVIKKDEIGHPENPLPGNGCVSVQILFFFFDLRVVPDHVLVAEETFFYGRQAGIG